MSVTRKGPDDYVLVRATMLPMIEIKPFAIVHHKEWEQAHKAYVGWETLMRGTWDEVNAIAKLLPRGDE